MTAQKILYEKDFYGWCNYQAEALVAGHIELVDLENLAEEIRSVGNRERWELINNLTVLLAHLLKLKFQSHMKGHSWKYTILEHRDRVKKILKENPSLNPQLMECVETAYGYARIRAAKETMMKIENFPKEMPFTFEDAMKEGWVE
jgi:hypothetical protein